MSFPFLFSLHIIHLFFFFVVNNRSVHTTRQSAERQLFKKEKGKERTKKNKDEYKKHIIEQKGEQLEKGKLGGGGGKVNDMAHYENSKADNGADVNRRAATLSFFIPCVQCA